MIMTTMIQWATAVSCLLAVSNGFTIPPSTHRSTALAMSMRPTYDALAQKVVQTLGLHPTDFTASYSAQSWNCNDVSGTAEWMSEASPKWLTGVSLCTRVKSDGTNEQLTINIWMGPSYDVPHLLLTFGEMGGGQCAVAADYVVRGGTPLGSDPQYIDQFYGPPVQQAWNAAYQTGQAMTPSPAFELRVLDSPAKISVAGLDIATATQLVTEHVDRFLQWLQTAQPVPARSRGSMNLRDDKLRQYFYRGQVTEKVMEFGNEAGPTLAAVYTGPTAEAYVGGGS